jgi:acetyl esterase/lipase
MKNNSYLLLSFLLLVSFSLSSQNSGCDGIRYKDDVFAEVKKTTVVYAPTLSHVNSAMELQMDVYEPVGDALTKRPVVVLAHGGSFIIGDRTMMDRWCKLLAKKGYVAATISYRLYPFLLLGFPDSLKIFDTAVKAVGDMRAAVRYFREDAANANLFMADADHIFVGGYSAGAVTALHLSYLDENDDMPPFLQTIVSNNGGLEGISGTPSNKTFSSSALATVNMSGGLYRSSWIDADEVPLVSIHGTADGTVPYVAGLAANIAYLQGSSMLHAQANDIGLWNSLQTVPGGDHGDIYESAVFQPHLDSFWISATTLLEALTCATVSVKDPYFSSSSWSIYPNPSHTGSIRFELPEGLDQADVQIFNVLGELMSSSKGLKNNALLNIQDLPTGTYLVQLLSQEKSLGTKVLLVD